MTLLDRIFSDYAWYRWLRGGTWRFDPMAELKVDPRQIDKRHVEWTEKQKATTETTDETR